MTYLLGENVQLGLGVEATRGTGVAPQAWIPARTPTGIVAVVEKAMIRESRGTGISSQASEIVQVRAEGDLEFNVRNTSVGYILKSLLGGVSSVTASGATTHTFTRTATSPQLPALTLALAQPGHQDYQYPLAVVSSLEIKTPIDDLVNATASFVASKETAVSNYTPAFAADTDDVVFRQQDVTIKFAADVASLSGASAVCIKEFNMTIANNARPNQCIGNLNPGDIFSLVTEISGSFTTDYEGATAYYDLFKAGTARAMEIKMVRDDLPVLGTSALYPQITIVLPKVTFEGYSPTRTLDDIVMEGIDFTAHYDGTEGAAITVDIQNEQADYDAA